MEGRELYQKIAERMRLMDKMYRVPQELHLTLKLHKMFFKYLEDNPNARGKAKEFSQIEIMDIVLDIIPAETIPQTDEDTGEIIGNLDFELK